MKARLIKGLVLLTGGILLLVTLLLSARDFSRIANWSQSGFVLTAIMQPDSARVVTFFSVDPSDYISAHVPTDGDTLLQIGDSAASLPRWIQTLEKPHKPGREVPMRYLHGGDTLTTLIKSRPVQKAHFIGIAVLQILKVLIALSFIALGFWAFLRRSASGAVRSLAYYCFAMAGFPIMVYMPMFREMASFTIPLENPMTMVVNIFRFTFSGFWLLLNLLFPRPLPLIERRRWLPFVLCFLPQILVLVAGTVAQVVFKMPMPGLRFVIYGITVAQVVAGLYFLRYHYITAASAIEKRQTKLVLWGSGLGLVLFLVYLMEPYGVFQTMKHLLLTTRLVLTNFIFAILLLSPVSLAYAIGKYRLLEVEGRLRRGTRYLLVTVGLIGVFLAILYLVGSVLLERLDVDSHTPTLLVALVLALGFAPAQRNLQSQLEKRFFPERERMRQMLRDFLRTAISLPDQDTFCRELEARLRDAMGIGAANLVLASRQAADSPFHGDSPFMSFLRRQNRPLLVDEAIASGQVPLDPAERAWFEHHDVALILPLNTHDHLLGFLALGHQTGGEDFHPEELQILAALADQIAVAADNLRLLAENVEKQRMEEELHVARRVQEQFLPKQLPECPGLELAAHSTFCLEVAGDYYDVIPLPSGATVLAVGDVSGKGAGAALLMANLQAALRALCSVGLPLPDVIARINDLIHQNTDSEQYITLFVGLFDPRTRTLRYVNGGHNPPLLIRSGALAEALTAGGLILGAFSGAEYSEGVVRLMPEDLLVLYSDGITEVMNSDGQEWGESRLQNAACTESTLSSLSILHTIMSQVNAYQTISRPEDDQTLLIAKIH